MSMITEDHRKQLLKKKPLVWATIIPTRTTKPVVSLHTQASHAKNAVSATSPVNAYARGLRYMRERGGHPVGEAEVYELVDGEWVLRWYISDGTYPNELPWKN